MKIIVLMFCGFILAKQVWGEPRTLPQAARQQAQAPSKNFKFGGQLVSYRYVEPGLISHTGLLYGLTGEYVWFPTSEIKGLLLGDILVGKINYDGALCDVNTNACSDYAAKTNEFILRMTHRFETEVNDTLHLFVGPGIRFLYDKGDDPGFYTRFGTYLFIPAGFNINLPIQSGDQIFADFEYDIFIAGVLQSKISEVNSTYQDITHKQKSGSGHKITIGYQQDMTTTNPLTVALFYENWNIAASGIEQLYINGAATNKEFVEPKNFSESIGIKAAINF